jgi:hypothetical protein
MGQAGPHYALQAPLMKGRKMHTDPPEGNDDNSMPPIPEAGIVAYNLREGERPAGLKVRYKIRIETGLKARELDEAQAEIIRELLEWARQYHAQPVERQQDNEHRT